MTMIAPPLWLHNIFWKIIIVSWQITRRVKNHQIICNTSRLVNLSVFLKGAEKNIVI